MDTGLVLIISKADMNADRRKLRTVSKQKRIWVTKMTKTCFGCGCSYEASRSDQLYCCPACRKRHNNKYTELILPIKKKWFDMILAGIKTEEYREIKPYWEKRFKKYFGWCYGPLSDDNKDWGWSFQSGMKSIVFRNGYGKNAPQFSAECTIEEKTGKTEWGAEDGKTYYVLKIHRIYNLVNCTAVA